MLELDLPTPSMASEIAFFCGLGVPIKRQVVGVAMGLVLAEDGRYKILTDILGSEDALGDMDFKVAGDADDITAFQMDIKVCRQPLKSLMSCIEMQGNDTFTCTLMTFCTIQTLDRSRDHVILLQTLL